MVQEHVIGEIQDVREDGRVIITAGLPDLDRALLRQYKKVEIILPDGRRISAEQRRKVYAILGEIAEYVDGIRNADTIEEQKRLLKMEFMVKRMESAERRMFSLSDCDMSTAREFITYLIDFIIANDIPTKVPLIEQCEDVSRYIYSCLANKKCCICGKPADLHHVQSVGSQGYRDKINHIGLEALPLCREHHTESHTKGQIEFMKQYHLEPIKIDAKIAKIYKLNTKEK